METRITIKSLLCVLLTTFCISCRTQHNVSNAMFSKQVSNSEIKLNDSISDIIANAEKIQCRLVSQNPLDTVRTKDTCEVPYRLMPVVSFLISDPSNFETNEIVYGMFSPSVRYEFEKTKGQTATVEMDFGLKKLRISDSQDSVILMTDMPSTSHQLLRLTRLIFPDDVTLKLRSENQ
ncbi:MAG: hypothetical protein K2G77_03820 [Muribaculaceae bacterium]|nr:hypothetical protein [Muribaculaceae bacterium]